MGVDDPGDPLEFPAEIPVKVMGEAEDDFESWVVSVVRRHVDDLGEGAVRTRRSRRGRYLSVTVTVRARSREQMDALYRELSGHERVKVVL
ncbi:MAG: YbeD family protein [Myxococcota bacterium]